MPTFEEPNEHIPVNSSPDGTSNEYIPRRHKGYRRREKSSLKTLPVPKSEIKKWDPAAKLERKYKQNSKRRRKRGPSIWLRIINAIRKKLGLKPLKNKRKDRYYRNKYKQRYNKKKSNNRKPQQRNQGQQQSQRSNRNQSQQKQNGSYRKKPYKNYNRKPNKGRSQNNEERKPQQKQDFQNKDYKPKNRKPNRNRKPPQQGGYRKPNKPE